MAITIHKILSDTSSPDGKLVLVVLTDGTEKRKCVKSGLPDDNTAARAEIVAVADSLWADHVNNKWDDTDSNIETSKKTANDKIPSVAEANASNSVPALRAVVADLIETVEALKEQLT